MDHAMFAAGVIALAIGIPFRVFHQIVEGCMVLIGDEIAWPFPPFDIPRGIAPGRASQFTLAA